MTAADLPESMGQPFYTTPLFPVSCSRCHAEIGMETVAQFDPNGGRWTCAECVKKSAPMEQLSLF